MLTENVIWSAYSIAFLLALTCMRSLNLLGGRLNAQINAMNSKLYGIWLLLSIFFPWQCFDPGHMTPAFALMKRRNDDLKSVLYGTPKNFLPRERPRSSSYGLSVDWRRSLTEREGEQEWGARTKSQQQSPLWQHLLSPRTDSCQLWIVMTCCSVNKPK